jgi:CheY-like chemotaxis protein
MDTIKIAIIDDSACIRETLIELITSRQCLLDAEFKTEAFERTEPVFKRWEEGYRPDLIISDMRIPEDLDGPRRLAGFIKSSGHPCLMIFITQNVSEFDKRVGMATELAIYVKDDLTKTFPEIIKNVREVMASKNGTLGNRA